MPFNSPFKTVFTAGDLIYGLATMRGKLAIHFVESIIDARYPLTVDHYRKSLMTGHNIYKSMDKKYRKDWKDFLAQNEMHEKYSIYTQHIRKYANDEELFAEHASPREQNAAWRAKSKFGIEWTIRQRRGTIHFVLDGLDMAAVVTKTHRYMEGGEIKAQDFPKGPAQENQEKERTITHSELRWIYRNRNNPEVAANVQFWKSDSNEKMRPCPPPWEDSTTMLTMPTNKRERTWSEAWTLYKPRKDARPWD